MSKYQIFGIAVVILGIGMFLYGVSMFTYQGPSLNPILIEIGEYSFLLWLPTMVIGTCLLFVKKRN